MNKWFLLCGILALASAAEASAQAPAPDLTEAQVRTAAQQMAASLDQRITALKEKSTPELMRVCDRAKTAAARVAETPVGQAAVARERYRQALRVFIRASLALGDVEFAREHTPEQLLAIATAAVKRFGVRAAALRDLAPEQDAAIDQVETLLATAATALESSKPRDAVMPLRAARASLLDIEEAAGL